VKREATVKKESLQLFFEKNGRNVLRETALIKKRTRVPKISYKSIQAYFERSHFFDAEWILEVSGVRFKHEG